MSILEALEKKQKQLLVLAGQEAVIVNEVYTELFNEKKKNDIEIKRFKIEKNTNLDQINVEAKNSSLFTQKSIYIFSCSNLNFARDAKNMIIDLSKNSNGDLVVFHFEKDDVKTFKNSKFYNDISRHSYDIFALEPGAYEFKNMILKRAKYHALNIEEDALSLFISLVDGNFTFAENELKKLKLIHETKNIRLKDVAEAISGNTKYDGFYLLDLFISGNVKETKKVIDSLRNDNADPIMMSGLLSWFFKPIVKMKIDNIELSSKKLLEYRVFGQSQENSKRLYKLLTVKQLEACLLRLIEIDLVSKGIRIGDAWNELEKFILGLARIIHRKKAKNYGH